MRSFSTSIPVCTFLFCFCFAPFVGAQNKGDQIKSSEVEPIKDAEALPNEWETSLRESFAEFDQLIITQPWERGELLDVAVTNQDLRTLLDAISIEPGQSGFHCLCDGDYHFNFYKDGTKILSIGYHHGRSLRWHNGKWKGDGLLTAESRAKIRTWFDDRGFPQLTEDHDRQTAEAKKQREEYERFTGFFPMRAQEIFREESDYSFSRFEQAETDKARRIANVFDNQVDLGVACCQAMSVTSEKSWSSTGGKERIVQQVGRLLSGEDFGLVLKRLEKTNDRQALPGAARFFFWDDYYQSVPESMVDSWLVKLARIELNADYDSNKAMVVRILAKQKSNAVRELLHDVTIGTVGKFVETQRRDHDPGLQCSAWIALAMMNDDSIKQKVIDRLASEDNPADKAALEICLILLGDPENIRSEHFQFNSYTLGYAAIAGIERFQGRHGLDVLIESGLDHSWARVSQQAVLSVERIVGKKWFQDRKNERPDWHGDSIKEWWAENKTEVLKELQNEH